MPIQEIQRVRSCGCMSKRAEMLLVLSCAPVLKGSKAANIMTVTRRELSEIGRLLHGTGIFWRVLDVKEDKTVLYLYREKELQRHLRQKRIADFLAANGYENQSLLKMLEILALRLWQYDRKLQKYPHEMGVFLGYPLEDVIGFIENEGKNYIYLGYWKVYHDVPGTVELFERYDREREQAVNELLTGKSIREIIA